VDLGAVTAVVSRVRRTATGCAGQVQILDASIFIFCCCEFVQPYCTPSVLKHCRRLCFSNLFFFHFYFYDLITPFRLLLVAMSGSSHLLRSNSRCLVAGYGQSDDYHEFLVATANLRGSNEVCRQR
jgi:hypothetical protein